MDRKTLYAQFKGDEVNGKFYDLGEALADDVDPGTTAYLVNNGRFAATKPGEEEGTPFVPDTATAPANMTRADMIAELTTGIGDDDLRRAVEAKRDRDDETARNSQEFSDDSIASAISGSVAFATVNGDSYQASKTAANASTSADTNSNDNDPLATANGAIEYVGTVGSVDDLKALREREVAGKDRTTVVTAIDKRIEALTPAA